MNPFQSTSMLNRPLSVDTCQMMIFSAANTTPRFSLPSHEDMLGLRELAGVFGREVYIVAPPTVEQLFRGVTVKVYQEAQSLFCSPIFRRHHTIWRILSKLAEEAHMAPPTPEAIWAICGYLSSLRDERIGPLVAQSEAQWQLCQVLLDVTVSSGTMRTRPEITCVVDVPVGQVIAFHRQKAGESREHAIATTLYDALSMQRKPAPLTPGGLIWSSPRQLIVDAALSQHVATCCAELGISILATTKHHSIVDDLQGTWTRTLAGRVLSAARFDLMLDTYLKKRYGHGPRTAADDAAYDFRHLDGYNRDPALMLPPLRWLLPACNATVDEEGAVSIAGRRYHDDLLRYWTSSEVTARISRHDSQNAYIYLDGEILCRASQAA